MLRGGGEGWVEMGGREGKKQEEWKSNEMWRATFCAGEGEEGGNRISEAGLFVFGRGEGRGREKKELSTLLLYSKCKYLHTNTNN